MKTFRPLDNDDLKPMVVEGLGDGKRKQSWIWLAEGAGDSSDAGVHDGMSTQSPAKLEH